MPADSSAIDNALVALLGADSTLLAAMPNGVYLDEAPPGSHRFVIVSVIEAADVPTFDGRALERVLYLVKAVGLSSTSPDMRAAAARIDALLEDQPLIVEGYEWVDMYRTDRIRMPEVDDLNPALRWYHRGGHYRVTMAPITTARQSRREHDHDQIRTVRASAVRRGRRDTAGHAGGNRLDQ